MFFLVKLRAKFIDDASYFSPMRGSEVAWGLISIVKLVAITELSNSDSKSAVKMENFSLVGPFYLTVSFADTAGAGTKRVGVRQGSEWMVKHN